MVLEIRYQKLDLPKKPSSAFAFALSFGELAGEGFSFTEDLQLSEMSRREALVGLIIATVVTTACSDGTPTSPGSVSTTPTTPAATPTPGTPRAQLVTPSGKYKFELLANVAIASVSEAIRIAGLTIETQRRDNWNSNTGVFAGELITSVNGQRGNWLVHLNQRRICVDVSNSSVAAGNRVGLSLDDGVIEQGCA